jgi:hypothetical protein
MVVEVESDFIYILPIIICPSYFTELNKEQSRKKTTIQENWFKPNHMKIPRQCSPLKQFLERTTLYNQNSHPKYVSPVF